MTVTPVWTLGDRLAKARETARISQGKMAEKLFRSRQAIGGWEHDLHRPTDRILRWWAEVTNVPLDWLLDGEPSATPVPLRAVVKEDLVTLQEAAQISGKSLRTMQRYVTDGRLQPVMKLPGRTGAYLFRRADVARFILESEPDDDEATA